ncbi:MAG: maleylpyruvate isomerase N-terminal domain-containing protein [Acidimicrobiales bacterium]
MATPPLTPDQTRNNLLGCFDQLQALIESLPEAQWAVQSLCPDWTVRGVVTHLAAVEHVLDGWRPTDDDVNPPFARMQEYIDTAEPWSIGELTASVRGLLDARRGQLAETTDEQFAHASGTPVGPATYQRFMDIRTFDFWVHQRDMCLPLARPTVDDGPDAVRSLDEVDDSIGYIVGRKIALPDPMTIRFHLTGPVKRDIDVAVEGRATRVHDLPDPDVTVTTDSTTFIMLACGRLDPQAVIDRGDISWTGDATWGDIAARNLRFTM